MHYTLPTIFAGRQSGLPYGPTHAKYKAKVSRRAGWEFLAPTAARPTKPHVLPIALPKFPSKLFHLMWQLKRHLHHY